ncbi:MAG: threonylcarbamoyl-AMP synthase [Clostridia bacterium]|nr:threonylcarbamoyl-AMP synthase [Clostridia bacterium]
MAKKGRLELKETKLFHTTKEDLESAAQLIREGKTVIFPTETVYGLGANAMDEKAVREIFKAKGRPADNPLIVHIDSLEKIGRYVKELPRNAQLLAEAYWPGPMTLILPKKECISDVVSAGLMTVGIRIPQSAVAREFLKNCDLPVAAPSANLSGSPSPTTFEHCKDDMMGRVDGIICGEDSAVGLESTVIDACGEIPVILRPGGITPEMIKTVCGDVIVDKSVDGVVDTEKPKSPGMKYRHYAPNAEVILVKYGDTEKMRKLAEEVKESIVLLTEESVENFGRESAICIGSQKNPETVAHNLFRVFRECDKKGYKRIILEEIEDKEIGLAVMNRAKRAAKK